PKAKAAAPTSKTTSVPKKASDKKKIKIGEDLAEIVVAAANEHKPIDPVLLNMSALSSVASWFFIAGAENSRQVVAIAEKIVRRTREKGFKTLGAEGLTSESRWAVVDFGDLIVHIFNQEVRGLYDLEGLWSESSQP
ncbi:MAG: ribosome silencing factor, partial [Candidatus Adiutrix sp.]